MKTLEQLKNWRCIVLGLLFLFAMLLGGAEVDGWKEFIISKAVAFILGAVSALLYKYWAKRGLITFEEE